MKEKLLKKLNAVWQAYITREELAIKLKKQGLVLLDFPHSFYGNRENYFIVAFKQKIWIVKHNMTIKIDEALLKTDPDFSSCLQEEDSEALALKVEPKFVFYLKEEFEEIIQKEIIKYQKDLEKLKNGLESLTSLNLPKNNWKSRLMNFWKKNSNNE